MAETHPEKRRLAWEHQVYGDERFSEKITRKIGNRIDPIGVMLNDPVMIAMSMLSDAQELIAQDHKELARQMINQAKYVLHQYLQPKGADQCL